MSRTYSVLCLNHTPPLEIDRDLPEWRTRDGVAAETRARTGVLALHVDCELVMAEYSGGLIALGYLSPAAPHGSWIELEWARLLYAAGLSTDGAVAAAVEHLGIWGRHWPAERLHKLRGWLGKGAETWA